MTRVCTGIYVVGACRMVHLHTTPIPLGTSATSEPAENTMSVDTAFHLYVAHSHCMQRAENPPLLQPVPRAHILAHRIIKIEGNRASKFVHINVVPF